MQPDREKAEIVKVQFYLEIIFQFSWIKFFIRKL